MIDQVVNAVTARVGGLTLSLGGNAVPVLKAKAPRQDNGSTYNTQITVCPSDRPKEVTRSDVDVDLHVYKVRVTIWSAGNLGQTAGAADYSAWQDSIEHEFLRQGCRDDLSGVLGTGVFDTFATQGVYVERGSFGKGWDVQALDVTVSIVRARA